MNRRRILSAVAGVVLAVGGMGLTAVPASAGIAYEPQIDHLKCYESNPNATQGSPNAPATVKLRDQFGEKTYSVVRKPTELCNPAAKIHNGVATGLDEGIVEDPHLVCHDVRATSSFSQKDVWVFNQFGQARLTVVKPTRLCLPSFKFFEFCDFTTSELCEPPPDGVIQPEGLDHFLCYETKYRNSEKDIFKPAHIRLFDQFDFFFFGFFGFQGSQAKLTAPKQICNPVQKTRGEEVTPITNEVDHLVCFGTEIALPNERNTVFVQNQFGRSKFTTKFDKRFCVPSLKVLADGDQPPIWGPN